MKYFEGQINHDSETISRLFKVEYDTYELRKVIFRYVVGAILAVAGLSGRLSGTGR